MLINDNSLEPKKFQASKRCYPDRYCEKCDHKITYKNWARHLKSKRHLRNDPTETIKSTRIRKPANIFYKPRKLHKVFNFSNKIFEKEKVRTIVKTEAKSFKNRLQTYLVENRHHFKDMNKFLENIERLVFGLINKELNHQELKVNIFVLAEYKRGTDQKNMVYCETNLKTQNEVLTKSSDLAAFYSRVKQTILNEMEVFESKGSQWVLNKILSLELRLNKYNPLKGASYIALPECLANKKAIINVKNSDNKCFLWSILSALHPKTKNAERVTSYNEWEHEFDKELEGINFPVKLTDINKFEKRTNMSINVYFYENYNIAPLQVTKDEKEKHIDLLYLKESGKDHYCWIKNLWRLVGRQITKHESKRFLCKMCLNSFYSEEKLKDHKIYCSVHGATKIEMPKKYDNVLQFKNYQNSLKVPWAIYADFECMLQKISTCHPNPEKSYLNDTEKHEPVSFAYYLKDVDSKNFRLEEYFGPDAPKVFYEKIKADALMIAQEYYDKIKPMKPLTSEERISYETAKQCHICERSFDGSLPPVIEQKKELLERKLKLFCQQNRYDFELTKWTHEYQIKECENELKSLVAKIESNSQKVRDHSHLSGQYRGPAHSICNLGYQNPRFIPIYFHNLAGYDAHLFIKEFGTDDGEIKLIPNTEENYISFSKVLKYNSGEVNEKGQPFYNKIELRFIDSFKFLSCSLDKLTKNLDREQFMETRRCFSKEHLDSITRKLAYPYEYMDSTKKYDECELPSIDKFYSALTGEDVKKTDYENAKEIWKIFNIKNLREFTLLYNKIDVMLLADVIENFRNVALKTYKLDPAWYYTTPGFAWDCMLKMTDQKFELLTDYDMSLMIEAGIRGGISQCSNRYSKANNKYMGDKFKKHEESIFIEYVDANNLYGWAMSKCLPYGGFKWVDKNIDVLKIPDNSPKGYILEVDLIYPKDLHNLHSDFPLAPEGRIGTVKLPKLFTTLYDKENYVVHYRNLKDYLRLGMKLTNIHRVLEFDQSEWLKPYIDFNTKLRQAATNDFEKDFYKLMVNSVFGKTMENIRNRVNIKLCSNVKQVENMIAKPNFERATIFTENLAAIHMKRTKLCFNKPIYIGMSILDNSKLCIYDFFYDTIKKKYEDKVKLLFTDTDSLILEIKTEDFYEDLKGMIDHFDTSDYPKDNVYQIPLVNKKVLGKFKDELKGDIIEQFVGLRSKLYALKIFESDEEIKRVKGVKKNVTKNEIRFEDLKKCLETKIPVYKKQKLFKIRQHEIYTIEQNKKALCALDDKRYILPNGIDCLAHGHYEINKPKDEFLKNALQNDLETS